MVGIPSIQYSDLKSNHTISGTAEPNATVYLFNPAEGRYIKSVDADASGNFDFGSLDASIPLQIRIARPNDFTCISISDVIKPATTPQLHTGKMIIKLQYFPGAEGQQYFITGPKGVFIDRNGPGSGAEITFELASPGDIFIQPGADVPYDPYVYADTNYIPSVGGHPLKAYTITSFGHSYVDPVLILTGTIRTTPSSNNYGWGYFPGINPATGETYKQQYPGGAVYEGTAPPPPEHYAGYGWEVSGGAWYGKLDIYEEIPCFTCPTDANDLINNIISRWGQADTWGQYSAGTPKTYGPRLMAQVPSYSNIKYNNECATEDSTQPGPALHTNALNQLRSAVDLSSFYNGKYALAYYSIIYGQDPNNINIIGYPGSARSDSAVDAYNRGLISKQELDILKGYFGKELLVGGVLHIVGNQLTNQIVASLLLLGYNIAQGVIQTSILQEMGSVWRQGKGVLETDMSGRVRTILTKMQAATGNNYIDNLQVRDANNVIHQWNFTGSAPTSTVP